MPSSLPATISELHKTIVLLGRLLLMSVQPTAPDPMHDQEQIKEVNNELVVPAYRQFCRENGLEFHFWDELPPDSFKLSVANCEFELHKEAMQLFNSLKPKFHVFRGEVVSFHFESWDGQFSWHAVSLDQFTRDYARMQEVDERYKTLFRAMVVVTQLFAVTVLFGFFYRFAGTIWFWLVVVACIAFGYWPSVWWFKDRPSKKRQRELQALGTRLARLREKLNELNKLD